jgi:ABC-type transport system involved in multi-copper enzyme maturation permease subunit
MNFKQLLGTAIKWITIIYNTIISRTAKQDFKEKVSIWSSIIKVFYYTLLLLGNEYLIFKKCLHC